MFSSFGEMFARSLVTSTDVPESSLSMEFHLICQKRGQVPHHGFQTPQITDVSARPPQFDFHRFDSRSTTTTG